MNELEEKMLRLLTFEPQRMPRNRNFAEFERDDFRRIRRRAAHLRSLRKLGAKADDSDVRIHPVGESDEVSIRFSNVAGGSRIAILPAEEFRILLEDETFRALVARTALGLESRRARNASTTDVHRLVFEENAR